MNILINMYVTYSIEKQILVSVPPSAIEYKDEHSLFLSEDFLVDIYKAHGIDPVTVDDLDMEILK